MMTSVLVWLLACGGPLPNRIDGGIDNDGDGYASEESGGRDCDDADPNVNPVAPESCDGTDENCDGIIDDRVAVSIYSDADGDGYGGGEPELSCDPPSDGLLTGGDCNDDDATVYPGATELCDGIDNDCDGEAEQAPPSWWPDTDGDGFGAGLPVESCDPPEGYVANDDDCDDGLSDVNPSATEICNNIDDNCNGDIDTDAGQAQSWWTDADSDGYGDASASAQKGCEAPTGTVGNNDDCDDAEATINPAADEVCNEVDDDCDGTVDVGASDTLDWYVDGDLDGFGDESASATRACSAPPSHADNAEDCDDDEPDVNPSATEVCNSIDDDCDGAVDNGSDAQTWYADVDGDGYGDTDGALTRCSQPSGYVANGSDCNDDEPDINPDGDEVCDGLDNDCANGADDNACGTLTGENCEPRFFGGHNYLFCNRSRSAIYYAGACDAFPGYYPVRPQSDSENAFLANTASSINNRDWWIGVDDVFNEGDFQWAGTNISIPYDNWNSGEPNNAGNEDCTEIQPSGGWNDESCFLQQPYICEHN